MNGISVMPFVQSGISMDYMDYNKNSFLQKKVYLSKRSSGTTSRKDPSTGSTSGASSSKSGRSRSSRRRRALLLRSVLLALILAGMTAGFQIMTRASSRPGQQSWKYYTTVTIPYGEDLHAIVLTYRDRTAYPQEDDYIREICEINGLPYRAGEIPDLSPGTKIVIPYYSTEKK